MTCEICNSKKVIVHGNKHTCQECGHVKIFLREEEMKKVYTMNEVIDILRRHGFEEYGWKGSHYRMRRGDLVIHICRNNPLWKVYVKKILRRAKISEEELEER